MNAQRRITRKEMKQDKLVSSAFKAANYVQQNKQVFIIGAIVIVAVGIILYFFSVSEAEKREEALVHLGQGDVEFLIGNVDQAIEDYKLTIEQYGSTLAGRKAYIHLGTIYNNQSKYEEAKEIFTEYLDKFNKGKPYLLWRAALVGAATAHRNLGEYAEAAKLYEKALDTDPSREAKAYLLLDAASCYTEAGQYDQALPLYEQVQEEYPFTTYTTRAELEIAKIEVKQL